MKKSLGVFFLVLGIFLGILHSFAAAAGQESPYYDRMAFVVRGDVLVHVNFPFVVPYGNCGQTQVYEYEQSYRYPPKAAYWKLLSPGDTTTYSSGIYLFRSDDTTCDPTVEISGKPFDGNVSGTWKGLEVEPKDIGILSPVMKSANVFKLSEDDKKFSYILVFNPFGYKTNLGTILDNPNTFNMYCESAGVIVPDQRGFLREKILWGNSKKAQREKRKFMQETIIDRDDIFVNICREKYY